VDEGVRAGRLRRATATTLTAKDAKDGGLQGNGGHKPAAVLDLSALAVSHVSAVDESSLAFLASLAVETFAVAVRRGRALPGRPPGDILPA
jgi:hypothetical protein